MGKLPFLFLSIILSFSALAQSPFGVSKPEFKKNIYYFDLNGSLLYSKMRFAGTHTFDNEKSKPFFNQSFGVGFRAQFSYNSSISAKFTYRELGAKFPNFNNTALQTMYLNVFVPFEYDILNNSKTKNYLPNMMFFAGPYVAHFLNGDIQSDQLSQKFKANDFAPFDIGLEGGMGVRVPTFSFTGKSYIIIKASYYYGLLNTFPAKISYGAETMNLMMLSDKGRRFNHGLRFTLAYELSLTRKEMSSFTAGGDGKKTYKRILVK